MLYSGQESTMLRRSRTMNGGVSSGLPGNALTRSKTMPLKMSSAASCEIRFGCLETMPTQGLGSYSRIQYTSTLETIYEENEEDCELTQSNEVASDTDTVQSSEVGSYTDAVQSSEAGSYNDLTRTRDFRSRKSSSASRA
ncbi:hypothetical protein FVE85_2937 [Porphyridium purpureum]|uniref:Uncharacterized protein n=1 Tax=Porphyridium purpureum TaxID=35688 RepID=A0A5J4YTL6_PORPP|nr:hypothetical protein FVE85_2937 [Porphyridium purpureum]|eukprot:POR7720..scf227_4